MTVRVFYTYFSPTGPRSGGVVLRVISPPDGQWHTADSVFTVEYRLLNRSAEAVFVRAGTAATSRCRGPAACATAPIRSL